MPSPEEFEQLLELPDDQLREKFAIEAGLAGAGMVSPRKALKELADAWINERLPQIRKAICTSGKIRKAVTIPKGNETRLHIVVVVAEVLGHHLLHQPGIAPLSVLITKIGVDKMCAECWAKSDKSATADPD